MLLVEVLKENIENRYLNEEYLDINIIEEYVDSMNSEFQYLLLKLQFNSIKNYLTKELEEKVNELVKLINYDEFFCFEDAEEMALVLRTGVKLLDEEGKIYRYEFGLLNPYRVTYDNIDIPIDDDWYKCMVKHLLKLL